MKQCSTRRRIAVVACVVLFSVAVIGLSGQGGEDCSLTVHVRDELGQPVSNATVRVGVIYKNTINAGASRSDWSNYTAIT
nr:hypothetical protein [Kiritimatiellia bacterium]